MGSSSTAACTAWVTASQPFLTATPSWCGASRAASSPVCQSRAEAEAVECQEVEDEGGIDLHLLGSPGSGKVGQLDCCVVGPGGARWCQVVPGGWDA